jgi:hypothetical protein
VLQLVVTAEVDVVPVDPGEGCEECGNVRYPPHRRGLFPRIVAVPEAEMARTRQRFGSGGSSQRQVVVSKRLANALKAEKIRDAFFAPVSG